MTWVRASCKRSCDVDAVAIGEAELGKTERTPLAGGPAWPELSSTFHCPSPNIGDVLSFELWHCHRRGTGYFLGRAEVEIDPAMDGSRRRLALKRKPGAPQQTYVQGFLDVSLALAIT